MQSPTQLHPHAHLVGCLSSDQKLLNSLLKEAGWDERHKAEGDGDKVTLPIEWVVDIADKDGDWFIGTATGYNDAKQSLHVMVPDRDAPTWTGDVSVNPLVRPCCVRPTILQHALSGLCTGFRIVRLAYFFVVIHHSLPYGCFSQLVCLLPVKQPANLQVVLTVNFRNQQAIFVPSCFCRPSGFWSAATAARWHCSNSWCARAPWKWTGMYASRG